MHSSIEIICHLSSGRDQLENSLLAAIIFLFIEMSLPLLQSPSSSGGWLWIFQQPVTGHTFLCPKLLRSVRQCGCNHDGRRRPDLLFLSHSSKCEIFWHHFYGLELPYPPMHLTAYYIIMVTVFLARTKWQQNSRFALGKTFLTFGPAFFCSLRSVVGQPKLCGSPFKKGEEKGWLGWMLCCGGWGSWGWWGGWGGWLGWGESLDLSKIAQLAEICKCHLEEKKMMTK